MKFNKLIPELYVTNLTRSLDFYKKLGFIVDYERPESKFVFISLEGSQLMLQQAQIDSWQTAKLEYPFGRGINFQITVKDIKQVYKKAKDNFPIKVELIENHYKKNKEILSCKEFLMHDPDGYLLRFSQDV